MSLSYLEIRYMCENEIYTREILIVDPNNFIEFVVGDEIGYLICKNYNIVNLYMIGWFISTIRVDNSGLKY